MPRRRTAVVIALTLFALLVFVPVALAARTAPYFPGDVEITRALQSLRSPWLDTFMYFVTLAGSPPQTLLLNPLIVLIVLLCRLKAEALTLAIFIPTFGTVSTWLRHWIDRSRPGADLVWVMDTLKDRDFSFPSGHTVNFLAVMGFLLFVGLVRLPPSWHRNLLLFLYALFFILMGISRVYVGDHWPSDVLAGYWLGLVFLAWMILFYQWVRARGSARRAARSPQVSRSR